MNGSLTKDFGTVGVGIRLTALCRNSISFHPILNPSRAEFSILQCLVLESLYWDSFKHVAFASDNMEQVELILQLFCTQRSTSLRVS